MYPTAEKFEQMLLLILRLWLDSKFGFPLEKTNPIKKVCAEI